MKEVILLKAFCNKSKRFIKHNAPTILTWLGGAGVIVTSVLTADATVKAVRIVDDLYSNDEEPGTIEKIKKVGPLYIPAVTAGVLTIACNFGANALNKRQQSQLIAAYTLLNTSYKRYRHAAKEVYGDDADQKIQVEMAKDVYIYDNGFINNTDLPTDLGETMTFYEPISQRYFESTIEQVQQAEYHTNRNLCLRGFVPINEFYSFLGLDDIEGGDEIGWDIEHLVETWKSYWLDFDHAEMQIPDNSGTCYAIFASCDTTPFGEDLY